MKITRRQFLKRFCFGSLGLLASYPFFIERYIVLTNVYRIPVPNLPKAFTRFRIVQLSDLHYGLLVPLELVAHVVERANMLNPDLIVCTGDYVHERNSTVQIDQVWPVLSKLSAPKGVYSVLGNHDHWADTVRSDYWLKKSHQDLRHKVVRIERKSQSIWLAQVICTRTTGILMMCWAKFQTTNAASFWLTIRIRQTLHSPNGLT